MVYDLELPYPPSVNHYWRLGRGRVRISRSGRAFREAVGAALAAAGVRPLAGPLSVQVEVFPPDATRRDLDNLQKALLDALAHGGAYEDDSQIESLSIEKRAVVPGGRTLVTIRTLS